MHSDGLNHGSKPPPPLYVRSLPGPLQLLMLEAGVLSPHWCWAWPVPPAGQWDCSRDDGTRGLMRGLSSTLRSSPPSSRQMERRLEQSWTHLYLRTHWTAKICWLLVNHILAVSKKKTLTLHKVGLCPTLNGKAIAELRSIRSQSRLTHSRSLLLHGK